MQHSKFILYCILINIITFSCTHKNYINKSNYQFKSKDQKPDYTDLHYWAAHPWKWNPSDSIPASLKKPNKPDSIADVFFIHPTTFVDNKNENWNAAIDDSLLNIKTDYSTILYQASTFNEQSRIFAPRYRQAHLKTFFTSNKLRAVVAFELAYSDIKKAFEYYLSNFNNGKPIILAAHSQGTIHAARLLKEFFEGKELQKQLVCAYLVGMPAPTNYFSKISPCKDSTATGCFVSWRTFNRNYIDTSYISKETFKCYVTNPLTWTLDTNYASNKLNTGGVLKNFNRIKKGVVDAQVYNNILWSCKPKFFGNFLITNKNYHIGDINLFYTNIRQNVKTRIEAYQKK
jgi:hypothetical protein